MEDSNLVEQLYNIAKKYDSDIDETSFYKGIEYILAFINVELNNDNNSITKLRYAINLLNNKCDGLLGKKL